MARPYQLNMTPPDDTLELLDKCVEKFGGRHSNARTRVAIAAEVMQQFLPVWVHLMEKRDTEFISKVEALTGGSLAEIQESVERTLGKLDPKESAATTTRSRRTARG